MATYCEIHQHYKWCEHNGGVMGANGWRAPPPTTKGKTLVKIGAITQAHLIKLLLDGDRTCQELADETGLHYVTVLQYTRELHKVGAAHICRWEKDVRGRDILKIYKLGKGKDAKREKLTGAQRQERTRKRNQMAKLLGITRNDRARTTVASAA